MRSENTRLVERGQELWALEMRFDGTHFLGSKDYNRDFNVSVVEITVDTEKEWKIKIQKLKDELKLRKPLDS